MPAHDRWANRGERAAKGHTTIELACPRRAQRWAARPAAQFHEIAQRARDDARAELGKAISGRAVGSWFGVPAARRHLRAAVTYSTIAAGLDLLAGHTVTRRDAASV